MSETALPEALRTIPLLADLDEQHVRWIAEHCDDRRYQAGDVVMESGAPADVMVLILEGELEGRADDRALYTASAGQITGKLPHSRLQTFPRAVKAVMPVRVATLHEKYFGEMLAQIPELEVRLVRLMADRIRETTAAEVQQSKLAALGKLSAGFAHELNNPASAATRAAANIRQKLEEMRRLDCAIATADLSPESRGRIIETQSQSLDHAKGCTALDALTRSDREEELGNQLTSMGVKDAWDLAPELIDAGFTAASLKKLAGITNGVFVDVLARIALLIALDRLAEEVQESTGRISSLVKSIKEYSYMDTVSEREVDVHRDLENTLRILGSKIAKAGVTIERVYDKELPSICANGSELNQVWTNLIDNAVDAMDDNDGREKKLTVRTGRKLDRISVEFSDTGSGIPESVRQQIFEPFFTTKKQGQGTGLGLDVVRRIVTRHHGDIVVESRPGNTCFEILLPFSQPSAAT